MTYLKICKTLCLATAFMMIPQCSARREVCYIEYIPSTTLTSINIIDRNGISETVSSKERLKKYQEVDWLSPQPFEKVLRVYTRDSIGEIHAYITSYYENGLVKQYLEVVNARAKGIYQEWHENGAKKLEATVLGGDADLTTDSQKTWLFEGTSEVWDDCGNLEAHFCYSNGALEGHSYYYHRCGSIWKSIPFCQGLIDGTYFVYLENGQLFHSSEYVQGKKSGTSLRYWMNSALASEEFFCENEILSGRYWDCKGNLICEVIDGNGTRAVFGKESVVELQEIRHGNLEGEVRSLGAKGEVVRLFHTVNGLKHGEEIEYYPISYSREPLRPQISINWWEGKIQGVTKTWFPNGVQESQREMSGNKKNGFLTAWYTDGAIMLMEEYDQDKIVRGQYYKKGDRIPVSEIKNGTGTATLYDSEGHLIQRVNYIKGAIE